MTTLNVTPTAPLLNLAAHDLDALLHELHDDQAVFSPLFPRREQRHWSQTYLHGLLRDIPRTSVEPMLLHLHGANPNALRAVQQFIAPRAWDDRLILEQVWRERAADIGDDDGVLIVDGRDVPKQGQESVGVKRQ